MYIQSCKCVQREERREETSTEGLSFQSNASPGVECLGSSHIREMPVRLTSDQRETKHSDVKSYFMMILSIHID